MSTWGWLLLAGVNVPCLLRERPFCLVSVQFSQPGALRMQLLADCPLSLLFLFLVTTASPRLRCLDTWSWFGSVWNVEMKPGPQPCRQRVSAGWSWLSEGERAGSLVPSISTSIFSLPLFCSAGRYFCRSSVFSVMLVGKVPDSVCVRACVWTQCCFCLMERGQKGRAKSSDTVHNKAYT